MRPDTATGPKPHEDVPAVAEEERAQGVPGWIPALIVLLAVFVRAWHLTSWDMWTDEMHTLRLSADLGSMSPAYISAPINFILTSWSVAVLGQGELGARAVPFLAGVLTVCLVYWLGRTWVGGRAAALAAAFLALSPWHVYWSQTARHFSLQVLFTLLAIHSFLAYWKQGRKWGLWASPLFFLLALGVHSSSVFFLLALLAFVLGSAVVGWLRRDGGALLDARHRRAFISLAAALVVFIPISVWVGTYLVETTPPWNPLWNLLGGIAFYIPPYLALAATAGAAFLLYEKNDLGAILLVAMVVPIVLLAIASRVTIAGAPYVLALVIPVAWLVGLALDRILKLAEATARWAGVLLVSGLLLAQAGDLVLYHTVYHGLKPRWREAAAFVRANERPGDVVVAAEADVMQFYNSHEQVKWYSAVRLDLADGRFPPPGTEGVWYVIYTADEPLSLEWRGARGLVLGRADLRTLLPLHYGPKDRTLGVFYEVVSDQKEPGKGPTNP
jgi:uncharacterized membrane protein